MEVCTEASGEKFLGIKKNTLMCFFRLANNLAETKFFIVDKETLKGFILKCIFQSDEMLSNKKLFKQARKLLDYIEIDTQKFLESYIQNSEFNFLNAEYSKLFNSKDHVALNSLEHFFNWILSLIWRKTS
jgi:hypothetical protein